MIFIRHFTGKIIKYWKVVVVVEVVVVFVVVVC